MARFRKQIYKQTRAVAKTHGLNIGKPEYEQMIRNFRRGSVWIPYTHSADPRDNVGFVFDLFYNKKDNSLMADMEIVEEEAIDRVRDKLVKDVSVSLYEDEEKGFVLEHVALTMSPGFKPQKPFVELEKKRETIQIQQEDLDGFTQLEETMKTEKENETTVVDGKDEVVDEKEEVTVDSSEETTDLEETKSLFQKVIATFSADEKTKKVKLDNKNLVTELEASNEKVTQLEAIVVDAKEAVTLLEEEKRVREWNLVFDNNVGKKCIPAEKAILFERINGPDELKIELEARADLGLTEKTIEADNTKVDNPLAGMPDDEVAYLKEKGWDTGKDLEEYLSFKKEDEQKNEVIK